MKLQLYSLKKFSFLNGESQKNKTATVLCQQGIEKYQIGEDEAATTLFNQAIQLDPYYVAALINYGVMKANLGQTETAIKDFDFVIQLDPTSTDAFMNRGIAKNSLGQHEAAVADFDRAIQLEPTYADVLVNRGVAKDCLGQSEAAITDFNQAIQLDPRNADAFINRGVVKNSLGQTQAAILDYEKAIQLNPTNAVAFARRGAAKYNLGQKKEAILDYDQAIQLDPKNARAFTNRGRAKVSLGQIEAGIMDHDRAIQLDPKNTDAFLNRGIAKDRLGQKEAAIIDYDHAIQLDPKNVDAFFSRGTAKNNLGQSEAAIADYDRVVQLDPRDADAFLNRGVAKNNLGQSEAAIADFDRVIQLKPIYADAFYNRGVAKHSLGQHHAALTDYDRAIQLNPQDIEALIGRGLVKYHLGQYQAAIVDYDHAIQLNPQYALAFSNRGLAKEAAGFFQEAQADFDMATQLDSNSIQKKIEKEQKTEKILRQQLQLSHPDKQPTSNENQPQLQNTDLITLMLLMQNKLAKKAAREAFQQHPNLWDYYRRVNIKLEEIFIGCKSIASGLIDTNAVGNIGQISSTLDKVATGIDLLGKVISLIPLIDKIGQVASAASAQLQKIDNQRQVNILQNISQLGTLSEITKAAENTARQLTERYKELLLLLNSLEAANAQSNERNQQKTGISKLISQSRELYDAGREKLLKEKPLSDAELLADFAVLLILETLQADKVKKNQALNEQFVQAVITLPTQDSTLETLSKKFGMEDTVSLKNGQQFSLRDFYRQQSNTKSEIAMPALAISTTSTQSSYQPLQQASNFSNKNLADDIIQIALKSYSLAVKIENGNLKEDRKQILRKILIKHLDNKNVTSNDSQQIKEKMTIALQKFLNPVSALRVFEKHNITMTMQTNEMENDKALNDTILNTIIEAQSKNTDTPSAVL